MDVLAGVTQDFSSTLLLWRLPMFFARSIQLFLSLVDFEVEFLFINEIFVLHLLLTAPGFELTSQRQKVSRLPTEPPGRPASCGPLNW